MNTITRCKPFLGTFVEISISGTVEKSQLIEYSEIAFNEIKRVEDGMSFHREESELSKVNRSAAKMPIKISSELVVVLRKALEYSELSDGRFDVTTASTLVDKGKLPDHGVKFSTTANWKNIELEDNMIFFQKPLLIDLGGIAKGYAVDQAFGSINRFRQSKKSLVSITVNAGGDLKMWPWKTKKIAIRIPKSPFTQTTDVFMQNSSLATSGPYFGGSIVDKNGNVTSCGPSVSIFSEHCIDADALTKIYSNSPEFQIKEIDHKYLTIDSCGSATWRK